MKWEKVVTAFGIVLASSLWVGSICMAQVASQPNLLPANSDHVATISPTNVDLHALKGQLESFQLLLNRTIQQNFALPFSLLQDAKGIYLPGFGVAFHLEVNLHPLRLINPFDMRPYTPEELQKAKQAKLERIRQLKAQLSELMLQHGGELSAMAPEQNIAIVVHLFNLPSESRDLPTQLVIEINRLALLESQTHWMTAAEFQKAGSVLEF